MPSAAGQQRTLPVATTTTAATASNRLPQKTSATTSTATATSPSLSSSSASSSASSSSNNMSSFAASSEAAGGATGAASSSRASNPYSHFHSRVPPSADNGFDVGNDNDDDEDDDALYEFGSEENAAAATGPPSASWNSASESSGKHASSFSGSRGKHDSFEPPAATRSRSAGGMHSRSHRPGPLSQPSSRASGSKSGSGKGYMTPVGVGVLPMVLSYMLGGGEVFTEIFLAVIIGFFCYKLIKDPWELYDAYHQARIDAEGEVDSVARDEKSIKQLRWMENVYLMVICLVPFALGGGLRVYRLGVPQYASILNDFNITLFVLCASVNPMQTLFGLSRSHVRNIQQKIHYPHQEVANLAMRIAAVEKRLDNLKTKVVSQQELTDVQDVIKPILAQLLKTVKNVEERSNDLDKSMRKRMADVETTLGLSSPPPSSFTEPYVEWTVARMTRSMMRMALAPILFPAQMMATTLQVLTKPTFSSPTKALPASPMRSSSKSSLHHGSSSGYAAASPSSSSSLSGKLAGDAIFGSDI